MGAIQCCSGMGNKETIRSLEYEFGEDKLQHGIQHTDSIETIEETCKFFLLDCQERLKKSCSLYKDPTLSTEPLILKQSNGTDHLKCTFNRPYYFLKEKRGKAYHILHEQQVSYSDISINHDALQYFSMFLCFIADKPHLIKNIILTSPNTYGIHAVAMYVYGSKKSVFVDDYVLCYKDKPIFSQPIKGKYMWPCLIEKAWLKAKGYASDKILITSPMQVFQHFLLYPFSNYNISLLNKEAYGEFKETVLRRGDSNFIVTSKKQPPHKIGLSGRRSYYLRCYFQFQGKKYYYLRNPCGLFDFRGNNRILTKQLEAKIAKQAGQNSIADGNFILEEEEFLQQIEEVLVVHYNRKSMIISEETLRSNPNDDVYLKITLDHEEEVSISFLQEQIHQSNAYYPVTYQIISQKQHRIISGFTNDDGCFGIPSTNLLENPYQNLPPGQYLIRLKKKPFKNSQSPLQPNREANDKIVITASRKIDIDYAMTKQYERIFNEFLIEYGRHQTEKKFGEGRFRGKDIEHSSFWVGDLVMIYIKKIDKTKQKINLEVHFPDRINLECISHPLPSEFAAIPLIEDEMLIIFEKIDLTEQTILGKYFIQTF